MKLQKRFARSFLLIFVLIIGFGYLLLFLSQKELTKTKQLIPPTPTQSPEWKTFTNEELGFLVQYPVSLQISEQMGKNNEYYFLDIGKNCIEITSYTIQETKNIKNPDIAIIHYINYKDLKIGESKSYTYPKSKINYDGFILKVTYKRLDDKVIAGFVWFQMETNNNYENHGTLPDYFLEKNGRFWSIQPVSGADCSIEEIDKMLSTFKFIN